MKLSLLMFEGCPNSPKMLANLKLALKALGSSQEIEVVDITKLPANDERRGYGAPTALANGVDLFGVNGGQSHNAAPSCRLYAGGIPSVAAIQERLVARHE